MSYAESQRAWGTICLKNEIFKEFKQLKKRQDKFGYKLMFCREFETGTLLAKIKDLKNKVSLLNNILRGAKSISSTVIDV